MNDLNVAWNKAIRKMWRLHYTTHTNLLGPIGGQQYTFEQIVCRFFKFSERLAKCKNSFLNCLVSNCKINCHSYLKTNLKFIGFKYGALNCDIGAMCSIVVS